MNDTAELRGDGNKCFFRRFPAREQFLIEASDAGIRNSGCIGAVIKSSPEIRTSPFRDMPGSCGEGSAFENRRIKSGKSLDDVRRAQQAQIPAGRFGNPEEFGAICAFLCSVHAGYMTGQNVLADGGAYPGTF